MSSRLEGAILLVLGMAAIAGAQGPASREKKPKVDPVLAAHKEAVQALVTGLTELAEWCDKQKLDRERAHVLSLILVFDPESVPAHEGLGFVRAKGGGWERSPKWKEPGNRDSESLGDFKKKRAELGSAFLDAMAKAIEENRRDVDPALKARIVGDMNAIDALDPRTKTAAGEAQALGGKWVLAETAGAAARRKQLQGFARAAISAAGTPEPAEAMANENNWDIKWVTIVQTENLRVLGTGSKDETMKIAVLLQAAGELFAKTFDVDLPHQSAYRLPIYVVADANSKASFLMKNPSIKPDKRESLSKLCGCDVDGAFVVWAADTPGRIDCAVHHLIGQFLGRSFGIDANRQGAIYEGICIHLTWLLTGTRLTWTIGQRKYAQQGPDNLEDKLKGKDADWFAPGFDLLTGKNHPSLRPLLAKGVIDLSAEEVLGGFMFDLWLLEGRKDDAPRFLRRAGRNMLEEGSREAFGIEYSQLEDRWLRWAKEMRSK